MPKLYIANAKTQTEAFCYRVIDGDPVNGQSAGSARVQHIPPGTQVQISGELSTAQIDSIVRHHAHYGLVRVDEIDRTKRFAGICYSVDKPITASRISQLMGQNVTVLERRGVETRRMAAVSTNNRIESDLQESQLPGTLRNLEIEVVEERSTRSNTPETPPERTRVTRTAADAPVGRGRKRA